MEGTRCSASAGLLHCASAIVGQGMTQGVVGVSAERHLVASPRDATRCRYFGPFWSNALLAFLGFCLGTTTSLLGYFCEGSLPDLFWLFNGQLRACFLFLVPRKPAFRYFLKAVMLCILDNDPKLSTFAHSEGAVSGGP